MFKRFILSFSALAVVLVAIAVNEYTSYGSKQEGFKNVEVITEFKEGVHYTKVDVEKVQDLLLDLGIQKDESFEVFSFSCPACYGFEPLIHAIDKQLLIPIHQVQLGFEGIKLAELDYYTKHFLDSREMKAAKLSIYELMLDHRKTIEEKKSIINKPHELLNIDAEEITPELAKEAEAYAEKSIQLADALELKSTPSIYIGGKYLLNMSEIKSPENLFRLLKSLKEDGLI